MIMGEGGLIRPFIHQSFDLENNSKKIGRKMRSKGNQRTK